MPRTAIDGNVGSKDQAGYMITKAIAAAVNSATVVQNDPDQNRMVLIDPTTGSTFSDSISFVGSSSNPVGQAGVTLLREAT